MDEHFEVMGHKVPWLKTRPSELFQRQCFISIEADEVRLAPTIQKLGVEACVFWGADYPHYDCTYPGAVRELEAELSAIECGLAARIRSGHAERFLGGRSL